MLMDLTEKASPDRKVFSKSMKKLIGMNDPVAANYTRYLQRSNSGFQKRTINLPVLGASALSIRTSKDKNALPILLRQNTEKSAQRLYPLNTANQTNTSKLTLSLKREQKQGVQSISKQVDDIMNEVISTHSPKLSNNSAIKQSISTKKFKNVRVLTQPQQTGVKTGMRANILVKEILQFMMMHSCENKHLKKALKQDPEIYDQDLSRFSPIKLVKKSEELLGLYPIHQFKRQSQEYWNKPLRSDTYIKQLRTNKLQVRELQLKRH